MRTLLAALAVIAIGTCLNAADLTIAKNIRINLGGKYYPLGAPTNLVNNSYPLKDGGYLVTDPFSTNMALLRFTSTGALVWSNCFEVLDPSSSAFAELQDGHLAFLGRIQGHIPNLLFVIGSSGVGLTQYPLTQLENPSDDYTTLLAQTDGLFVGGLGTVVGGSYASCFVMCFSTNFDKVWQRDYRSMSMMRPKLASYRGGYVLSSGGHTSGGTSCTFAAVSTNGTTQWQRSINGAGYESPYGWGDNIVTVLACGDGGLLVGFSSDTTPGGSKTAPSYGRCDIWLVKLDTNGNKLWDHSFGGAGNEFLGSVQLTEDGGFLVAGWTLNSQVSGNKALDGDGVWLLKLTPNGLKESEAVIESYGFDDPAALLPAPTGYRLAVASWILDLAVRRVIDITAASTGNAFRLDYSHDLLNWTNIVSRYNGTMSLEEDMEAGSKFYRCVEVP